MSARDLVAPSTGPASTPASPARTAVRQSLLEARLLARNGEQLALAVLIPLGTVLAAAFLTYLDGDRTERLAWAVPGTLALAVLATAFTSLAIATGFERRYGVLRFLGATPLGRGGLLAGKAGAVLVVVTGQVLLVGLVALVLGWEPTGNPLAVVVLLLLGSVTFTALALLIAGALRADATLALANVVFLVLLLASGITFPLDDAAPAVRAGLELLPSTALADGLRAVLRDGHGLTLQPVLVLAAWGAVAVAGAVRWFRWD